jgi:hypothetical protein
MGLHFKETMSGFVITPAGERQFAFTVNADSTALMNFGGWAPMTLTGTATLEGVVEDAEILSGSYLEIGVPLHRYLRYQVNFVDEQGSVYHYFGQKTARLLSLPKTMTTLEGRLFVDGEELGPGVLRFNLLDLPGFLASWRPWATS